MLQKEKVKLPQLSSIIKMGAIPKDEFLGLERKLGSASEKKRATRKDFTTSSVIVNTNSSNSNNNYNNNNNNNNLSMEFAINPMQAQINQIHKIPSKSPPVIIPEKLSKSRNNEYFQGLKKLPGYQQKVPYNDLTTINLHYITKTGESVRPLSVSSTNAVHRILKNIDNKNPAIEEEKNDLKITEYTFEVNFGSVAGSKNEETDEMNGQISHARSRTQIPSAFYALQKYHQKAIVKKKVIPQIKYSYLITKY
jgi:hypothetical protein